MKDKILSIALMAIAAVFIVAAPAVLGDGEDNIPVSSDSVVTTTEPYEAQTTTSVTSAAETEALTTTTAEMAETVSETETETETVTTTEPAVTEPPTKTETAEPATTTTAKQTTTTAKKTTTTAKKTTTTTAKKTTTTAKKTTTAAPPKKPTASSGTPVSKHGQLSVKGANIVDKNGNKFQLMGMSTHGLGWFPDAVSKESFKVLRDDWGCNSIRLAMYIEESWGGSESLYLAQPQRNYDLVKKGVDACIDLGMYVVVDWHVLNPGNPATHTEDAKKFFAKIAKEYADYPNIIYEICNEPNSGTDWNTIKKYADAVIAEIRKYDKDAIIICGTPTWSQDIDQALNNPLSDKNTVYALHFYANTHTDWLRDRVKNCYNKGLPILVSEFGTCDASGNGGFNKKQTETWLKLLDSLSIGYYNWSFCNKGETASAFTGGTNLAAIKAGTSQLTESGKLIREYYRKRAGLS